MNTILFINDKPVCTSEQLYGRKKTSIDPSGKQHISDNAVCTNIGNIKKGDEIHLTSTYDSTKHPYDESMKMNGMEAIMAVNNVSLSILNWDALR
jgi:hypothetical protein